MNNFNLSALSPGKNSIIDHVEDFSSPDPIANRLRDLGFVPGETVKVIAFGPFGANPIAVQIGSTRFALRRSEAQRVILHSNS
ncbi:FeoA family protein [Commensalibacter sp. TBRC 16381]|uniref:FeoA family protein n=2 Tax=Commensalibacter oyaizuii TaxID=3043873 RepID=A0ABT6Q2W5_9PROT|nr:FeoA family protein [Commensalibacter sp. TBRC 16381]MDI2091434.1 FeoA family protein [Commensalibacter sp. TBRC 16381]